MQTSIELALPSSTSSAAGGGGRSSSPVQQPQGGVGSFDQKLDDARRQKNSAGVSNKEEGSGSLTVAKPVAKAEGTSKPGQPQVKQTNKDRPQAAPAKVQDENEPEVAEKTAAAITDQAEEEVPQKEKTVKAGLKLGVPSKVAPLKAGQSKSGKPDGLGTSNPNAPAKVKDVSNPSSTVTAVKSDDQRAAITTNPAADSDETDSATASATQTSTAEPAAKNVSGIGTAKVIDPTADQKDGENAVAASNFASATGDAVADTGDEETTAAEVGAVAEPAAGETSQSAVHTSGLDNIVASLASLETASATDTHAVKAATTPGPEATTTALTDSQVVETNHVKIVSSVHGQLLPNGGSMQIRLDPPELGTVQVSVHMRDGVMTASFETNNDDATKLLSHSLGQLKASLEAAGISVEKLHVQQSSKQEGSSDSKDGEGSQSKSQQDQQGANQEQQRREMLQRMWRRVSGVGDPVDLVA